MSSGRSVGRLVGFGSSDTEAPSVPLLLSGFALHSSILLTSAMDFPT